MKRFFNVFWDHLLYISELPLHFEITLIKCYIPAKWTTCSSLNITCSCGLYPRRLFNILSTAPGTSVVNISKDSYHNLLKMYDYFSSFSMTLWALVKQTWYSLYFHCSLLYLPYLLWYRTWHTAASQYAFILTTKVIRYKY